jgi:DNA polymerase-4
MPAREHRQIRGPWLITLGWSAVTTRVHDPYIARSRSRETTFQRDLEDWHEIRYEAARLARLLADDVAPSSDR